MPGNIDAKETLTCHRMPCIMHVMNTAGRLRSFQKQSLANYGHQGNSSQSMQTRECKSPIGQAACFEHDFSPCSAPPNELLSKQRRQPVTHCARLM